MSSDFKNVHVLDHPLVAAKLSVLRAKTTNTEAFRSNLQALSILLLAEAARSFLMVTAQIETPLQSCTGAMLARPVVLVPILRAGLGMLDGMLQLLPDAQVGHLGLYRDEKTLRPVSYYRRLPRDLAAAEVLLLDPMLATGHSACEAVSILRALDAVHIRFVCVVACPEGIAQLHRDHPDVPITAGAMDPQLNNVGYIVPGLGDAGDRYFGTD